VIEHKVDSILATRIEEQEVYVASRDYQVTKASRLNKKVDQIYPGHTAWYEGQMGILHGLEEKCERENPEAWRQVLLRRNAGRPIDAPEEAEEEDGE